MSALDPVAQYQERTQAAQAAANAAAPALEPAFPFGKIYFDAKFFGLDAEAPDTLPPGFVPPPAI